MIYVRWKRGEPRRGRTFPPLAADHPGAVLPCPQCGVQIGNTTPTVLVAVGPTDDEEQGRHDEGRWYNAGAVLLHEPCADSLDEPGLNRLASELIVKDPS